MPSFRDPHSATYFYVEIDDVVVGSFQEVTGLASQMELFEIKEGGGNFHPHKFANRATYGDITLKRGFWNNVSLFAWFEQVALETWTARRSGSIIMMDSAGNELCRWLFFRALPTKWDGPQLNAQSGIALESLTLSPEWIKFAPPGAPPPPPTPTPRPPEPEPEPIDMTVNFDFDKSNVKPPYYPELDALAAKMEEDPDLDLIVEGHTDSVGSASYNKSLSLRRANSVKDYLVGQGADPARITAVGYGEEQPIADNATAAGRAQNRRTDIKEA